MRTSRALVFISILLCTALLASAADLSGRVTFRDAPLVGAVVTADLIDKQGKRPAAITVTRTGPSGEYALRGLRNSEYVLFVQMNGRRIYQGRIVLNGQNLIKDIGLK